MKRWEYMMRPVDRAYGSDLLNKLGRTGWELVSAVATEQQMATLYFKRELPPEPAAEPAPTAGHVLTKQPEAGYMFPRKNRKEP